MNNEKKTNARLRLILDLLALAYSAVLPRQSLYFSAFQNQINQAHYC